MPFKKVILQPGINKQISPTLNEGGWSDGDLIRFRNGLPEKWKGWTPFSATSFQGVCRSLLTWVQLNGFQDVALGTNTSLIINYSGTYSDVTPVRLTASNTNPFNTVIASKVVTFNLTAHGALVGDTVIFSGYSTVDTITVNGAWIIASVPNANSLTFVAASAGASGVTGGGGTGTYTFLLNIGTVSSLLPTFSGWGGGPWGSGQSWGKSVLQVCRTWSLANWGQDLIANPRNGGLYYWSATSGVGTRAAAIPVSGVSSMAECPTSAAYTIVAVPERHVVAYGANPQPAGTTQDPLLIRWSDTEDYTTWVATATNAAGSFRISGGTKIVTALPIQGQTLILTDNSVYVMAFEGLPYVYGFQHQGDSCGVCGPNAAIGYNSIAFWMGIDAFYTYNGRISTIPCSVYDDVFRNINTTQMDKVCAGTIASFDEIIWFYPSAGSSENDSYVVYNPVDQTWWTGSLDRTAWIDRNAGFANPLATDAGTSMLWLQEQGEDANGVAMGEFITSGYFDISDGTEYVYVDKIIPDFQRLASSVSITVNVVNYPGQAVPTKKGPYTVTSATTFLPLRVRGRQASITIGSTPVGGDWRLGAVRINEAPDGRR